MNIIGVGKRSCLILAVILLLSMAVPVYADVVAAAPPYPYGLGPVMDDQTQVQQLLRTEWEKWKDDFLSTSGRKRVLSHGNDTVSESMGYGLLLSVYFNEQPLFDELYGYVRDCYDPNGLMHWKTNNGNVISQYSDTEADQNIALALIFADKIWDSDGQVDYETEAKTLLGKIQMYECDATGQLKPGDAYSDPRNPSYLVPGWYEIFRAYSGSEFWNKVRLNAYSLVKNAANATTGLVPNLCNAYGNPSNGGSDFGYDAIRVMLKMAVSYSWYGHADAKSISGKSVNFFRNIGAANIVDGYMLNGTTTGSYHSAAFVACAAAGTMTGSDMQLAKAFYDECLATEASDYYGSTLRLLSLMYMTGNLQNLYAGGRPITGAATTPSGTVQSGPSQGGASSNTGSGSVKNVLTINSLPIAEILEGMGGSYEWNSAEQKATIRWSGTTVELWNGKKVININGVKKEIDTAPNISTTVSKILSPRFEAEKPGCIVSWESGNTKLTTAVKGLEAGSALLCKNTSAGKWDGLWLTDMGNMALLQKGDKVIGTYGEDECSIEGTVSGSKLICKYNDGGIEMRAEFSMSADGSSFTGICGDGNAPKSDWSQWNGKR